MINRKNILIITFAVILALVFILFIIPEVYWILVFFNLDYWWRIIILIVITPLYFGIILWLLASEVKEHYKNKDKMEKLEKTDKKTQDNAKRTKIKDIDVKVRLVYNSIKKFLEKRDKFPIEELANILDIDYDEVYIIITNLLEENLINGSIINGSFHKK
ncbi:MAG: hypothetical protein ACTSQO_08430 [Candidatus Helarchaeota archaeon]